MNYSELWKKNDIETPCFIIDEKAIAILADNIQTALKKYWKNGIVGYSFKTNNFPSLISFFKSKGFYAEVVSSDEFELALEMGYAYDKIIFNGPVKRRDTFEKAIENGSIVNLDSKRELLWLASLRTEVKEKAQIGLRVNFCLENYCSGESQCGASDGRFGFSYESGELEAAINFLKNERIKISGLHLHCSSKTRSLNVYRAISNIASEIIDRYDLKLSYVDIGGGFFGGLPDKPSFDEYFKVVYENLKKHEGINVIIEPGMSVVGAGIDYVTTVIDVKNTLNNRFAVLDGSRIHIDPFKRKSVYDYEVVHNTCSEVNDGETIICGFTCMEDDRFFSLMGSSIFEGDGVVFHKVGAYTMGLIPQFIEFYPVVYAAVDNDVRIVRKKVTAEDFVLINKWE